MSKDEAETLHAWQRSQSIRTDRSYVLGQLLGMIELVERGLATPEHAMQQMISVAKEYQGGKL